MSHTQALKQAQKVLRGLSFKTDEITFTLQAIHGALSDEQEKPMPDSVFRLADNCPTEGAVLQREWRQQRDTIAELLTALEALLKVCGEELDPKRTPEMREACAAIAKARGQ